MGEKIGRRTAVLSVCLLIPWWGGGVIAAGVGGEEDLLFGEEERVVTPARHSLTVSQAPASVTVITEEEIEASGAQNLADLLREIPGLEVAAVTATDVNVGARGYNRTLANKLLVMIDGRSVYEDFFGVVLWEMLPVALEEIKQIEVVRGPGSAVYGANAYSGVIHIITKSPRELAGTTLSARTGVESDRREGAVIRAGRAGDHFDYKGTFLWKREGSLGDDAGEPGVPEPESFRGNLALTRSLWDRSTFTLAAGGTDGNGRVESGIGDMLRDNTSLFGSAALETPGAFLRAYWNHSEAETRNRDLLDAEGNPDDRELLQNTYSLEGQVMGTSAGGTVGLVGGSVRYHAVRSDFLDEWHDQTLFGVYAQVERTFREREDVTIGGRVDHHPHTDYQFSPRASWIHHFEGRSYLRLTAGEAYRNPTFIDNYLYIEDVPVKNHAGEILPLPADAVGNRDLKPERVRTYEIALGLEITRFALLRVEGFRNEERDRVNFGPSDYYGEQEAAPYGLPGGVLPKTLTYRNLYRVNVNGGEASLRARWSRRLETTVGYGYVAYEEDEGLPEEFWWVSRHKVTARLTAKPAVRWTLSFAGRYQSRASFLKSGGGDLPAWSVADAVVRYALGVDHVVLECAVQNLFDHRYREYPGGDSFGRRTNLRLRVRF
ncbi:MAG: TonB-dependent receptor [Candidatus Eisenbacteria bacterium]|nr:TonB-dependent receptor [Candidatus Eisenbacteria bacterium]